MTKETRSKTIINKKHQLKNIDFTNYEVEEAVETILDLVVFPIYIAKSIFISIILFITFFIGLSYSLTNHFWTGLFFFMLCFITSIPTQILTSVIILLNSIRTDFIEIFEVTLKTAPHLIQKTVSKFKNGG